MNRIKELVERKNVTSSSDVQKSIRLTSGDTNKSDSETPEDSKWSVRQGYSKGKAVSSAVMKAPKPKKVPFKSLIALGYPEKLDTSGRYRRRFIIHVKYVGEDNQTHQKAVKFGKVGDSEYIDHGNEEARKRILAKLRDDTTPIDSDFYRAYLLNSNESSIEQAWMNLRKLFNV